MRVLVDVDSTLWDFAAPLYSGLSKINPEMPTPDKWDRWAFYEGYVSREQFLDAVNNIHLNQEAYTPFITAKALLTLIYWKVDSVVIASHRNAEYKVQLLNWLDKSHLPYDELHVSHDKTVLFNDADLIIDDSPDTLRAAKDAGIIGIGLRFPWNDKRGLDLFDTQYEMIDWLNKFL
jgi:FMN phosphatase YigB (HAD superfamily)